MTTQHRPHDYQWLLAEMGKLQKIQDNLVEALDLLLESLPESVVEAANIVDEYERGHAALALARGEA